MAVALAVGAFVGVIAHYWSPAPSIETAVLGATGLLAYLGIALLLRVRAVTDLVVALLPDRRHAVADTSFPTHQIVHE